MQADTCSHPATMFGRYGRNGTAIRKLAHMAGLAHLSCSCPMGLPTWRGRGRRRRQRAALQRPMTVYEWPLAATWRDFPGRDLVNRPGFPGGRLFESYAAIRVISSWACLLLYDLVMVDAPELVSNLPLSSNR